MKTAGIIMMIFLLPVLALAQGKLKPMDEAIPSSSTETTDYLPPGQTIIYENNTAPVQQTTGKVIGEKELLKMPRRDVNAVAATVTGVDSRAGTSEVPYIRGAAQSGTAYYVDGVRIYGAMPIMTK